MTSLVSWARLVSFGSFILISDPKINFTGFRINSMVTKEQKMLRTLSWSTGKRFTAGHTALASLKIIIIIILIPLKSSELLLVKFARLQNLKTYLA